MAIDKVALQDAGVKLVDLVYALSDGVDMDDIPAGTAFLVALTQLAGDIQADPDAALLAIASGALSELSDRKVDVPE